MPEGDLMHTCEDGHSWREKEDGGVGPSWGFGMTSIHYPGWPADRCPEPERGWSRYDDEYVPDQSNVHHAYKCPSCGEKHYVGGCLMGVRTDPWNTKKPECQPPPPACGKPPVRTAVWRPGLKRNGVIAGWVDIAEAEPDGQLVLEGMLT